MPLVVAVACGGDAPRGASDDPDAGPPGDVAIETSVDPVDADAADADVEEVDFADIDTDVGADAAADPEVDAPDRRAEAVSAGDPHTFGPYVIGVTTLELTGDDDGPPIPVEVWYPAAEPAAELTVYRTLGVELPAGAYRDVPPDPTAPAFLVAFSHGFGGLRQQNYTMSERLASWGYIVVAPDHPGTTTRDFLTTIGDLSESLVQRPGTLVAAVDLVYGGAVPGLVPREGYGLVGHSLGAVTAIFVGGGRFDADLYAEACGGDPRPSECTLIGDLELTNDDLARAGEPDPRVVTAVLQNPSGVFAMVPETLPSIPVPLVIGGERNSPRQTVIPLFDMLAPEAQMAVYDGAGHNAATDICNIPAASAFANECGGVADGFADPDVVREVIVGHTVAWLGVHLGRQPAYTDWLGPGEGYEWFTH